jgi:two-component system alkaline phosphatase synthesis response regulator PhoP
MAKILVVDDDRDIVDIIRYTVSRDNHEVLEASDGNEGLARAKTDKPDLIILDIMMPELDGLATSTRLAAEPATKNIPVIILTAKVRMREEFASAPNVQNFMDKPFEPMVLLEQIRAILAAKRPKPV